MQTSDLPDLAHTHAGPMHWLATAVAMAAVVAAAGVLQPDAATASQPGDQPRTAVAAPGPAPDVAAAELPLQCGAVQSVVTEEAAGDLDGDGRPETVAAARCDAGSGTPPSAVYVLTAGPGKAPRVVATLLLPTQGQSVGELAVRDGAVTATLLGYSSADVPSCCPDLRERVEWRWQGGKFVRSPQAAALGV
ncbi:hypothetical protein QCN29_28255 [Streptomyces sp. HNM0663]|uniref:Secreted protein n=1 Tax=Streptomyces chengmaiensis TaxID=3040919 RepID=A0ABT6HV62_9ACTN|nr:hypothetical protein [Streptomyces chengmaiensis]MDH2392602.1 hypothetical protein [Streptomyces chengmaiensis]